MQQVVGPLTVPAGPGVIKIPILLPLSVPVTTGAELTTRILYPDPAGVFEGITHGIVPDVAVEFTEPIPTAPEKFPKASDS